MNFEKFKKLNQEQRKFFIFHLKNKYEVKNIKELAENTKIEKHHWYLFSSNIERVNNAKLYQIYIEIKKNNLFDIVF